MTCEIEKWHNFTPANSTQEVDLSIFDAHWVFYEQEAKGGKPARQYKFYVTYSFHCFAKEEAWMTEQDRKELMYQAPNDERPFSQQRYDLAKTHLRNVIDNLPEKLVSHAGYGSYAVVQILDSSGKKCWYFVPFRVFREKKKFRIHVTSAYALDQEPTVDKVNFFTIAYNLSEGKPLPKPTPKRT